MPKLLKVSYEAEVIDLFSLRTDMKPCKTINLY